MRGYLALARRVLSETRSSLAPEWALEVAIFLFQRCLFEVPPQQAQNERCPPSCKSLASRQMALDLLADLAERDTRVLQWLLSEVRAQGRR